MPVKTFQLRSDGDPEESMTLPDPDLMTAPQAIQKFLEVQPKWTKFNQTWSSFRQRIKTIILADYPNGYQMQNGKVLLVERTESVTDMEGLIGLLEESGHGDLVERTVDVSKLRDVVSGDPQLAQDVQPYLKRSGKGTLMLRGKLMAGHDFANIDVDITSPNGEVVR